MLETGVIRKEPHTVPRFDLNAQMCEDMKLSAFVKLLKNHSVAMSAAERMLRILWLLSCGVGKAYAKSCFKIYR